MIGVKLILNNTKDLKMKLILKIRKDILIFYC